MSQPLPRYIDTHAADQQKLARILLDSVDNTTPTTVVRATLAGDERRLRGIPCVARGVPGTSPGTDPLGNLIRTR